jgi:hypothetical protein
MLGPMVHFYSVTNISFTFNLMSQRHVRITAKLQCRKRHAEDKIEGLKQQLKGK